MKIQRQGWIGNGTDNDPYRPAFLEDLPDVKDWVLEDGDTTVHILREVDKDKVRKNNKWKNRIVSDDNPGKDDKPKGRIR